MTFILSGLKVEGKGTIEWSITCKSGIHPLHKLSESQFCPTNFNFFVEFIGANSLLHSVFITEFMSNKQGSSTLNCTVLLPLKVDGDAPSDHD